MKKAVVFGGSGFIGGYLVQGLVACGYCVNVLTRSQEKAARLRLLGNLGQVKITCVDLFNTAKVEELIMECDVAINLLGTISTTNRQLLEYLHVKVPGSIAKLVEKHKKTLIHFSAMAADIPISSAYAQSKLAGEKIVKEACKDAIIIRPNVVFGDGDNFFTKFAKLARTLPFLPIVGDGTNLLQPVYVGDVVELVLTLISTQTVGGVYEVCGPRTYSFRALMEFVLNATSRRKPIVAVPFFVARMVAFFCELKIVTLLFKPLTGRAEPVLTIDQVELMKYDIVASESGNISTEALSLEDVVPGYLEVYKKS